MAEAEAVEETAKAVQEVAKAAGQYQPSVHQLGEFIGKIVAPATEAMGLLADHIKGRRLELALGQHARVQEIIQQRGIKNVQPMPLSIAYPLLEAATVEEDAELSEMFSNLIATYVDGDNSSYLPKQFTETLKQMTPYEAAILKRMGAAPSSALGEGSMMYAAPLPASYARAPSPDNNGEDIGDPNRNLGLALASLQQLGCIEGSMTWGGYTSFRQVRVTDYGAAFLEACAPRAI